MFSFRAQGVMQICCFGVLGMRCSPVIFVDFPFWDWHALSGSCALSVFQATFSNPWASSVPLRGLRLRVSA